jgi:site-specific DNA-methyltransferase (adenine-specific)
VSIDLRLGRWQDALADVEMVDAVIVDAPYSAKTHSGHDAGARSEVTTTCERDRLWAARGGKRESITYPAWDADDVAAFAAQWSPRCRGWICSITDHVLAPIWTTALAAEGRYVFAPIPIVETGSRVRLTGDGPSSWTCWLIVARPRTPKFVRWGTLPGAYIGSGKGDREHIGGKDTTIMRAIVADYTRPGDLVCDPCAGAATTLLAAAIEGRRAIGSEMDPDTFAKAQARIARGYTPTLPICERVEMTQEPLL